MGSKASIHPSFHDQLTSLAEQCAAQGQATMLGHGRVWTWGSVPASPFDLVALGQGLDRSTIAAEYARVYDPKDPGTSGDALSLRFQNDYLAAAERALRLRHASAVRGEMFAAGRRRGLGTSVLASAVLAHAQNLLRQGQVATPISAAQKALTQLLQAVGLGTTP